MNSRSEDNDQREWIRRWQDDHSDPRQVRWFFFWGVGLCIAGLFLIGLSVAQAGGTVTDSKYIWLQRSGVTLTDKTTPPLACPAPKTVLECAACMLEMIDAEKIRRTSGYITYRCMDVSQSYVKFSKTTVANSVPTISGTPPSTATVGQVYSFTPTASDPDGDKLTFAVDNRPPWAAFDAATGKLSGTPAAGDVGVRSEIGIRVSDGKGGDAVLAFGKLTTVAAPTTSATISWTPPTQNTDGTALTNLAGYRLVYGTSAAALSNTIEVPNPAAKSYVIEQLSPATYFFAVKAYTTAGIESANSNVASKSLP